MEIFRDGRSPKVSIDSRNKTVGPVDSEQLVGKLTLKFGHYLAWVQLIKL